MFAVRWALGEWFGVSLNMIYLAYGITHALREIGLLRACELLEPAHLVVMLKAVKHLSMNATLLDVLQNANAVEILIRILEEQESGPHSTVRLGLVFRCFGVLTFGFFRKRQIISSRLVTTCAD